MQPASSSRSPGQDVARLIREHQAGVWRYLRSLGCAPSLADDLTQETFLAILERPFQEISPTATSAYLRKIAHNRYVSHYRRQGKIVDLENLDEIAAHWERWSADDNGEEMLIALRDCLSQLTDRARLALELRFRDDESREAIAARLAITDHGAKNLMQRAKQQLRECLEQKLGPQRS